MDFKMGKCGQGRWDRSEELDQDTKLFRSPTYYTAVAQQFKFPHRIPSQQK